MKPLPVADNRTTIAIRAGLLPFCFLAISACERETGPRVYDVNGTNYRFDSEAIGTYHNPSHRGGTYIWIDTNFANQPKLVSNPIATPHTPDNTPFVIGVNDIPGDKFVREKRDGVDVVCGTDIVSFKYSCGFNFNDGSNLWSVKIQKVDLYRLAAVRDEVAAFLRKSKLQ